MNVLFVCTGNTCRSPMAMGIFNELAKRAGVDAHADSCGIAAYPSPAAENAVRAAIAYGADISNHIACQINEAKIKTADRVYGMTKSHVRALVSAYPQYKDKIFPLSDEDIPDPFGGTPEEYEATAKRIHQALEAIINAVKEANRQGHEY